MKTVTQNTQSAKDAPKVDVTIKPESKPAPKSKKATTKKDAPTAEPKSEAKIEVPAPLKVDDKLFAEKLEKLNQKLEKEKRTTTAAGYHVAYGYFIARTKKGQTVILEFHQKLKPHQWVIRDQSGNVLGEPVKTLWQANETAVNQF